MTTVYGKATGNHDAYAVCVDGDQVWRATEVAGLLYKPLDYDPFVGEDKDKAVCDRLNALVLDVMLAML